MTAKFNAIKRSLAAATMGIIILLQVCPAPARAQHVGVGTIFPQKRLSINGSVMLDITNKNYGTLDSAALLFGSSGGGDIRTTGMAAIGGT